MTDKRAFAEDCARAEILISRLRAPPGCAAPLVVDRAFLGERGATAIRLRPAGPDIVTARGAGAAKPWHPQPPAAPPMLAAATDKAPTAGPETADPVDPPRDEPQ